MGSVQKRIVAPFGRAQSIVTPSGEKMVMLSERDYESLLAAASESLNDADDIAVASRVLARIESGAEEPLPFEVVKQMRRGNPIKALREHRGLTQRALAERAGTDPMYVSQLETGRARGGLESLRKLARVLGVPVELIAPKVKEPAAKRSPSKR
jgi:DNA-binding XRE family transcriptional regulator